MKRLAAILAVLVVTTAAALAQQTQTAPEGVMIRQTRVVQSGGTPPPPNADFVFLATESFGGKTVKGAPYSGEAVTERVQVLGDGNRIVNKFSSTVYRDSEGRTRREQTLKGLGELGTGNEPLQTIFISDPVAGVTYALDSRSRVAHKSVPFKIEWTSKSGTSTDLEGRHFEFKVATAGAPPSGVVMSAPLGAGPVPGPGARIPLPEGGQLSIATEGSSNFVFSRKSGHNEVKESLGKQFIEGVEAEGARTTVTIPAGEIGNERAIEIVSESWYSPELQLVVMTRHSDPRTGETTYRLTNINRTEPAKLLFEVPSDYTIKEGLHSGSPIPARLKKLANPE